MDWSRAKTVLILSFLLLNILLAQQLWLDELKLAAFPQNAEKRQEMNLLLEPKGIRIDTAVPDEIPALVEIAVILQERSGERVALDEGFPIHVLDNALDLKQKLQPFIPQIELYEADAYAIRPDDAVYVMNQLYGNWPMFEMRLELFAEQGQVNAYRLLAADLNRIAAGEEGVAVEHGESLSEQERVLSAYTVIGSLAEGYLPQGAVIKDIRLGYHGPIFESETQVLAPYWRVVLETGDIYFVHAINGAVEGPRVLENQES